MLIQGWHWDADACAWMHIKMYRYIYQHTYVWYLTLAQHAGYVRCLRAGRDTRTRYVVLFSSF